MRLSGLMDALLRLTASRKGLWAVAAGAAGIAAALYLLGVAPAQRHITELRTALDAVERRRTDIVRTVSRQEAVESKIREMTTQMETAAGEGLLTPLLESYAMRCKSKLDPLAEQAGLQLTGFQELPVIALPLPKGPVPAQLYVRQPVVCEGTGSYAQLIRFLRLVESAYPLAVLSGISVTPLNRTPERHQITLTFEWPVKGPRTDGAKGKAK